MNECSSSRNQLSSSTIRRTPTTTIAEFAQSHILSKDHQCCSVTDATTSHDDNNNNYFPKLYQCAYCNQLLMKTAQPTSLLASYTSSVLLNSSNQLHCPKCGQISYLSITTTTNQRAWTFCVIGTVLFAITVFGFIFTSLSIIKFGSNLIVRIIIFAGPLLASIAFWLRAGAQLDENNRRISRRVYIRDVEIPPITISNC